MFGRVSKEKVVDNVRRAVEGLDLKYDEREDNSIVLGAMGDDNPIGMVIVTDDEHKTLNIYCYLMFDSPEAARTKLVPELNTVNTTINNGGFYMADEEPKIYFKIVQSYYDRVPSVEMIRHLLTVAFKTVDINDGRLKDLIPADSVRKDPMFS